MQGGEEARGPLTEDELQRLRQTVDAYVADKSPDAALRPGSSMMFINAAFQALKDRAHGLTGPPRRPPAASAAASPGPTPPPASPGAAAPPAAVPGSPARGSVRGEAEVEAPNKGVLALREENGKLRLQVQQRDNEINILVSMLKKREATIAAAAASTAGTAAGAVGPARAAGGVSAGAAPAGGAGAVPAAASSAEPPAVVSEASGGGISGGAGVTGEAADADLLDLGALSDRNRAFEVFRKSYRRNVAIESSKAVRIRRLL